MKIGIKRGLEGNRNKVTKIVIKLFDDSESCTNGALSQTRTRILYIFIKLLHVPYSFYLLVM